MYIVNSKTKISRKIFWLVFPHTMFVYFVTGEHPAAMQRGCASNIEILNFYYIFSCLLIILQYLNGICTTVAPHHSSRSFPVSSVDLITKNTATTAAFLFVSTIGAAAPTASTAFTPMMTTKPTQTPTNNNTAVEIDLGKHILNSR